MTDNGDKFEPAAEALTDDEGHPIHPERGHRICGAVKTDRSTPAPHGRSREDYDYCLQPAGWGTDTDYGSCKNHPYNGSQIGEGNPNFKDGRTSEYFKSKLSERQSDVYDEVVEELADDANPDEILAAVVTRLLLLGEHSGDAAILREARQWAADFGVIEKPAEKLEGELQVASEVEHSIDEDTQEVLDDLTGGF